MKFLQSAALGLGALALVLGTATAADKDTQKDKTNISNATRSEDSGFAKLDKDKDGYITKSEAAADAALSKDFAKWDLNNDGKLNRVEYLGARAKEDTGSVANKVTGSDKQPASSTGSTTSSTPK
jgi:hypothetical protein